MIQPVEYKSIQQRHIPRTGFRSVMCAPLSASDRDRRVTLGKTFFLRHLAIVFVVPRCHTMELRGLQRQSLLASTTE